MSIRLFYFRHFLYFFVFRVSEPRKSARKVLWHLARKKLVPPDRVPQEYLAQDGTIPLLARLRALGNVEPTATDDDMPHYTELVMEEYVVWLHDNTVKPPVPSSIDVSCVSGVRTHLPPAAGGGRRAVGTGGRRRWRHHHRKTLSGGS